MESTPTDNQTKRPRKPFQASEGEGSERPRSSYKPRGEYRGGRGRGDFNGHSKSNNQERDTTDEAYTAKPERSDYRGRGRGRGEFRGRGGPRQNWEEARPVHHSERNDDFKVEYVNDAQYKFIQDMKHYQRKNIRVLNVS